jgi:hypothetical protein
LDLWLEAAYVSRAVLPMDDAFLAGTQMMIDDFILEAR